MTPPYRQPPNRQPVVSPPTATPFDPNKYRKQEPAAPEFVLTCAKTLYTKIQEIDANISRLHGQRELLAVELDKILGVKE